MRSTRLALRRPDRGQVVLGPFRTNDPRRRALVGWLARRPDVVSIDGAETLRIRFAEVGPAPGSFLRALRDRLDVLERGANGASRGDAPAAVRIVHSIPGHARLGIDGVDAHRLAALARWLTAMPGVVGATANPHTRTVRVAFDARRTDVGTLSEGIRSAPPSTWTTNDERGAPDPAVGASAEWREVAYDTALFAATCAGVLPSTLSVAAIARAALPSAGRSFRALRDGRLSVDVLDVAAIAIAVGTGQHATAAFITWLLSLGDVVLAHAAGKARRAIRGLLDLGVARAWRLEGDRVENVPADAVRPGDRLLIEAGARVPADGRVERGVAVVDEKALTGEPEPRRVERGSRLLAGSVVLDGEVVLATERVGADTAASRIVQIVEASAGRPARIQRQIERAADRLVLPTCAVAGLAGFFGDGLERATSVLITDFGTGVRIAIPTGVLATMTRAAADGILIRGGQYLERLSKADVVVFDKTGTLTRGGARIVSVVSLGSSSDAELLELAASLEARQRHPLARAIVAFAGAHGHTEEHLAAKARDVTYVIGAGLEGRVGGHAVVVGGARLLRARGIDVAAAGTFVRAFLAQGASTVFVAIDGRLEGLVAYRDEPREESRRVLRALHAGGRRKLVLLSGDAEAAVEAVAKHLGIDEARGRLLPEDKADAVRSLQRDGHTVAMVGDGINDAPALAVADVGISLGGATEVAIETAAVVLLSGGLRRLPRAFALADEGMRLVRRGVNLVLAPNAIAMGLGALGVLSPSASALINNGSTVAAALSGLTPLLSRPRRPRREPRQ
jgi:Cu2+-exporting ATPase